MGWLGSEYFPELSPDDLDSTCGRWFIPWNKLTPTTYELLYLSQFRGVHKLGRPVSAEFVSRNAGHETGHEECPVRVSEDMAFCIRHWVRISLKQHKDVLEAARKAHFDELRS